MSPDPRRVRVDDPAANPETILALDRAARSAGLASSGLDRILLVGGSSRIPLVGRDGPRGDRAPGRRWTPIPSTRWRSGPPWWPSAAACAERDDRCGGGPAPAVPTAAAAAGSRAGPGRLAAAGAAGAAAGQAPPGCRVRRPRRSVLRPTSGAMPPGPCRDPASPGPRPVRLAMPPRRPPPHGRGSRSSRRPPDRPRRGGRLAAATGSAAAASPSGIGAASSPANQRRAWRRPSASIAPPSSPSPTPVPTPTPTPSGQQARILSIKVSGGRYVVDYQVFGYKQVLPGKHVHFFFDTVPPRRRACPATGPWFVDAGPIPFKGYKVSDKPSKATQMCILFANPDHSVVQGTGNCVDLPNSLRPKVVDRAGGSRRGDPADRLRGDASGGGSDLGPAVGAGRAPRRAAAGRHRRPCEGRQVDPAQRAGRGAPGGDRRGRVHPDRDVVSPRPRLPVVGRPPRRAGTGPALPAPGRRP